MIRGSSPTPVIWACWGIVEQITSQHASHDFTSSNSQSKSWESHNIELYGSLLFLSVDFKSGIYPPPWTSGMRRVQCTHGEEEWYRVSYKKWTIDDSQIDSRTNHQSDTYCGPLCINITINHKGCNAWCTGQCTCYTDQCTATYLTINLSHTPFIFLN